VRNILQVVDTNTYDGKQFLQTNDAKKGTYSLSQKEF